MTEVVKVQLPLVVSGQDISDFDRNAALIYGQHYRNYRQQMIPEEQAKQVYAAGSKQYWNANWEGGAWKLVSVCEEQHKDW